MSKHHPPELDMTIDGEFVSPPTQPLSNRILLWAIVVAVLAGGVAIAAFALWIALMVLPIAAGAGLIAYGVFRYRLWQAQKALGGDKSIWRP